jgi:hypothetical protein
MTTTTTSTTLRPAETGTTYPLPPAPGWHHGPGDLDDGTVRYERELGQVELGERPRPDPEDQCPEVLAVYIVRGDWLDPNGVHVGAVEILGGDYRFTPAQAREFGACSSRQRTSPGSLPNVEPPATLSRWRGFVLSGGSGRAAPIGT